MSKLSSYADKRTAKINEYGETSVTNFMGGNSYTLNPIDTLRIVAASSIFGEPQYYREGMAGKPAAIRNHTTLAEYSIFADLVKDTKSADEVFVKAIDNALTADFGATLRLALELRTDYFMRLNPAVIFVRASVHPNRVAFNEANPGLMKEIGKKIALRPDDLTNQFEYYMYMNGSKKGLPSLVKRTWAERLAEFSRYQLNKYKGKRLIDLVRISHANSADIDELMTTGTIAVTETEQTWESLRSAGKTWDVILDTIKIPHMALLRNLRGIFTEITERGGKTEGRSLAIKILNDLKAGVINGKQFPFRYWSAYNAIKNANIDNKQLVLDTLEECIDIAVANMPKIPGKVACLSDNSGSAWGTFNSEYGSVTVAEIANLSSLITAQAADEGFVGVFGDRLSLQGVSKRNGLLTQLKETSNRGQNQGQGTENGIWLFWDEAIKNKVHYDTVFVYSDMQAGHGNLYGTDSSEYKQFIHKRGGSYIDVLALVEKYRATVNPKVNVFSVQVAGYNNSVLPENLYRGAILAGWTGKESTYAKAIIDAWDSAEKK
jgi:hypothetical protein